MRLRFHTKNSPHCSQRSSTSSTSYSATTSSAISIRGFTVPSGTGPDDGDKTEVNIGVAPEQIAVELRTTLDTIRYRWEHADDWSPRELGITTHAETLQIHPFTDGNGRTTRLLADLVFVAAQDPSEWQYDCNVDKHRYVELLRAFDGHRDARDLTAVVGVQPIES